MVTLNARGGMEWLFGFSPLTFTPVKRVGTIFLSSFAVLFGGRNMVSHRKYGLVYALHLKVATVSEDIIASFLA